MRASLIILVFVFLHGCALTQQVLENENLLQDLPLPGGEWTQYQTKNEDALLITWKKSGSEEVAMTGVVYGFIKTAAYLKEWVETPEKESCDKLASTVISEQPSNGYQSIVWKTICQKEDGFFVKKLHKVISGNDSAYLLKRVWMNEPDEDDWNIWLDYFNEVIVCDSRDDQHPCPAGYKNVGNY